MDLWVNADGGIVGLEAEPSFETGDSKSVEFILDTGVQIEVVKQPMVSSLATNLTSSPYVSIASVAPVKLTHPNYPTIRFLPDGTVGENSPQKLRLTSRDGVSLSVALARPALHCIANLTTLAMLVLVQGCCHVTSSGDRVGRVAPRPGVLLQAFSEGH